MSYNCSIEELNRAISCNVVLPRTSVYHAVARLNLCKSPAELDVTLRADEHVWQHSFIASNGYETRAVGKDYWPIVLHSIFEDSQQDNDNQTSASPAILVKACLQAVKPKSTVCFFNHLITSDTPRDYCTNASDQAKSSLITFSLVCFLIGFVFLTTLVLMVTWWRRMRRFKRIWKLSRLPLLPPPIPGSKPYLSTIRSTNSTSSSSEDVRKLTVIREISPSLGVAHLPVPPNQKYFYTSRYQKILSRKFWQRHHARCTTSTNTEMLDGCLISPGFMGEINSVSSSSGSSGHRDSKLVQTSTTSLEDSSSEGNVHSPRHFTIEMTAAMKQPVKESPL